MRQRRRGRAPGGRHQPRPRGHGRLIDLDPKLLRDACRLAVDVARQGEGAESRVPAPPAIRPVLGFSRLSAAAYGTIRRAVDDDAAFRARVAAAAEDEASVGRAGWLWLHRPDGWADDPALRSAPAPAPVDSRLTRLRREREGAEAAAARHRARADDAAAARRRVETELEEVRRMLDERDADLRRQAAELAGLSEERNAAVRAQKALEAQLAATRRDLRVAREATRQAEADLLARSGTPAPAVSSPVSDPPTPPATVDAASTAAVAERSAPEPGAVDGLAARAAVTAAAHAAGDLARALADAAAALGPDPAAERHLAGSGGSPGPPAVDPGAATGRAGPLRARPRASRRRRPALPPGMVAGTPEADRHLVRSSDVLVVVDGYNLARTAWSGLTPEDERRRTITLLEEAGARSGAAVEVVFDGDDRTTAPAASRAVRVRFSASGETADDAISDLLATLPADRAVAVVSTDRAVADDARRQGAEVLSSAAFLAAVRR